MNPTDLNDIDREALELGAHLIKRIGINNAIRVATTNQFFEELTSESERPLKIKIVTGFRCYRCGLCCRKVAVNIDDEDIISLCKKLRCTISEFHAMYIDSKYNFVDGLYYLKMPCPFYTSATGCSVYEERPLVCKLFPFNDLELSAEPCRMGQDIVNKLHKLIEHKKKEYVPKEVKETLKRQEDIQKARFRFRQKMMSNISPKDQASFQCHGLSLEALKKLSKEVSTPRIPR